MNSADQTALSYLYLGVYGKSRGIMKDHRQFMRPGGHGDPKADNEL